MNDLLTQLVLSENGEPVASVFIGGKPVLTNGRVKTIDEEHVVAKLSSLAPRIRKAQNEVVAKNGK